MTLKSRVACVESPITNTNSERTDKFRLVSLGWVADGENDFQVLALTHEAIASEVLKRHHSEHANLPVNIEQASDEARSIAIMNGHNQDDAVLAVVQVIREKGLGVSFWLLDETDFFLWKFLWEKRHELIVSWLESHGSVGYDTDLYNHLTKEFWALFSRPPLAKVSLEMQTLTTKNIQEIAKKIYQASIRRMDVIETNG